MQQIRKLFYLNFYRITFLNPIVIILIHSVTILTCLSGCNFLLHNSNESFLTKKNKVKINNESVKTNYYVNNIQNYDHLIHKGEKITTILNRSGVNLDDISKLIKTDPDLNCLKNGQYLSWKVNQSGNLLKLIWKISNFQKKTYKKQNDMFLEKKILKKKIYK